MSKSYTSLKAILIDKLEALVDGNDETIFVGVYGINQGTPDGYPICYVIEKTGSGSILDTHRNEREWQFDVAIHQERSQKSPEASYEALLDACDRVIEMFDQDPMLKDVNGQEQCKFCKVVPVAFEFGSQEGSVHRALLTVALVDVVNRYISA